MLISGTRVQVLRARGTRAINANRLAKARSHGSNLWELAREHVTMLMSCPIVLALMGLNENVAGK
jgi:hypothetical protein